MSSLPALRRTLIRRTRTQSDLSTRQTVVWRFERGILTGYCIVQRPHQVRCVFRHEPRCIHRLRVEHIHCVIKEQCIPCLSIPHSVQPIRFAGMAIRRRRIEGNRQRLSCSRFASCLALDSPHILFHFRHPYLPAHHLHDSQSPMAIQGRCSIWRMHGHTLSVCVCPVHAGCQHRLHAVLTLDHTVDQSCGNCSDKNNDQ